MSTRRREFRQRLEAGVKATLRARGIDDLALELDLVTVGMAAYDGVTGVDLAARPAPVLAPPADGPDLADWPEDARPVVAAVCRLWRLSPPRKGRKGGPYAQWILDTRDLLDAAGRQDVVKVLAAVRAEFERHMAEHGGVAPFTVSGPGSLVKAVRFTAGTLCAAPGPARVQDAFGGFYL